MLTKKENNCKDVLELFWSTGGAFIPAGHVRAQWFSEPMPNWIAFAPLVCAR